MYFSGRATEFLQHGNQYGVMLSYKITGGERAALELGALWMLDNGAFSGNFEPERWRRRMGKLSRYADTCRGVIVPDAVILDANGDFVRGDWWGTLDRLMEYAPMVAGAGLPIAYAVQDDHPIDAIPWDEIDVLFIAGTEAWKQSFAVEQIAIEAKRQGKRVHIGRVSSERRIKATWFADSWDGTTFKWCPAVKQSLSLPQQMRLV